MSTGGPTRESIRKSSTSGAQPPPSYKDGSGKDVAPPLAVDDAYTPEDQSPSDQTAENTGARADATKRLILPSEEEAGARAPGTRDSRRKSRGTSGASPPPRELPERTAASEGRRRPRGCASPLRGGPRTSANGPWRRGAAAAPSSATDREGEPGPMAHSIALGPYAARRALPPAPCRWTAPNRTLQSRVPLAVAAPSALAERTTCVSPVAAPSCSTNRRSPPSTSLPAARCVAPTTSPAAPSWPLPPSRPPSSPPSTHDSPSPRSCSQGAPTYREIPVQIIVRRYKTDPVKELGVARSRSCFTTCWRRGRSSWRPLAWCTSVRLVNAVAGQDETADGVAYWIADAVAVLGVEVSGGSARGRDTMKTPARREPGGRNR